MSTAPETIHEVEERLRAALTARADLVRAEDLAAPAPVVAARPRWRSPWVLVAAAAVVLLVLGVVVQGVGSRPRSDDVAPSPDEPRLDLPRDVGREWQADDLSTPARLDLDGDGTPERVRFLGEPTKDHDGRTRLQTTLSSTGEEAYGVTELGTTIGTTALDPVDADADGDQELVLLREDLGGGPGSPVVPLVFDLRDGLLVQAAVAEPDLLVRAQVPVPGSRTAYYQLVRLHEFWIEDGRLFSGRSVGSFAQGNMLLLAPQVMVLETWEWRLDEDGVLQPEASGCLLAEIDRRRPCGDDPADTVPVLGDAAAAYIGVGEEAQLSRGVGLTARIEPGDPPVLVVEGVGPRPLRSELDVADPRVPTVQPESVFYDGASVVVTSASDPSVVQVLVQRGDRLVRLDPVGEVPLVNDATRRTWLTENGSLVTVVAGDDDRWVLWQWSMVSGTEVAALPWGEVCLDEAAEPPAVQAC